MAGAQMLASTPLGTTSVQLRSGNSVDFSCKRHQQSCLVFSLLALQAGGHRFDPGHVHHSCSQTRIMAAIGLGNTNAFEFLRVTGMHWALRCACGWQFREMMNCKELQPISVRIFARTSASSAADIFPLCLARLFRQSRLLTWSARTALGLAPAITTSKG
jgi:hypothetical protein